MKLDDLKERKKLLESMVFTSNFNSLNEIMCDWIKDELTEVQSNIDIIERNIIYNNEMKIKMNSVLSNILSIYVKRIIWSYPIKNHEEKLILIKKRIKIKTSKHDLLVLWEILYFRRVSFEGNLKPLPPPSSKLYPLLNESYFFI